MVIVTTAVYWGLNSPLRPQKGLTGPLNLPAPGRRQSVYIDFTSSHGPVFLVNSRFSLFSAATTSSNLRRSPAVAPLLPKLRGHFAEFLNHSYPDRLSILYLTTCVGLGYGPLMHIARGFSRQHRITNFPKKGYASRLTHTQRGFTYATGHTLTPRYPSRGLATFLRHPITWLLPDQVHHTPHTPPPAPQGDQRWTKRRTRSVSIPDSPWSHIHGYGNINPLSIDYACRPRLRSRLTLGRLA